ncbi:hypothetical protein ACGFZP_11990 [Kitasatospora sp. NPDC048239]|uniref:hypothetical protein n=1 Tax=Kitasatospora sp. NPDC048239 TaxID=3364046 RepID=UPI00372065DC
MADAVPPPGPPGNPYEEHTPGPAALYEPPAAPVAPPTGWTVTGIPLVAPPPAATPPPFTAPGATPAHGVSGLGAPGGLGPGGPRGRILVVEGGYGNSGRRTWGRGGPTQAPVLSAMLAAVSPQVLLAADAVDAVHLPGASDPHTVLAHLRAAARHPGPLLVHLGGHLVADKRSGQLHLTLRDSKPGSVRQDGLPWQSVAAELRHRPADWPTLVIADLSADQNAWPFLQSPVSPLTDGLPLWAVVSPDPEQIGTFTRALIEALHGGRPGVDAVLTPEQLRQQVYSVLRPDVAILATHAPDRPFFRNTARRAEGPLLDSVPFEGRRPPAVLPRPSAPHPAPGRPAVTLDKPAAPAGMPMADAAPVPAPAAAPAFVPAPAAPFVSESVSAPAPSAAAAPVAAELLGPVSLLKAAVPPTPPPPARPVNLLKAYAWRAVASAGVRLAKASPVDALPFDALPVDEVPVGAVPTDAAPVDAVPEADALLDAAEAAPAAPAPPVPEPTAAEPLDAVPSDAVPAAEPSDGAPAAVPSDAEPAAEPSDAEPADEPSDATPAPAPADTPADAPVEAATEAAAEAATDDPPATPPRADYREVIGRIVRSADAGDHAAATDLAFALELEAIAEHGAFSAPVLQVRQVRAHVSRLAGRVTEAADIYREVALTLLRAQGPDHPETQQAATNAEACWRAIKDRTEAIRIAPEIIELRAYLPGTDGRKLRAAERYLAQLAAAGADHA